MEPVLPPERELELSNVIRASTRRRRVGQASTRRSGRSASWDRRRGRSSGEPQQGPLGRAAAARGARVVHVAERIRQRAHAWHRDGARARCRDGRRRCSYDFLELPRFLAKPREGYDPSDAGDPPVAEASCPARSAAPPLARGPDADAAARWWFRTPLYDVDCGDRGFSWAFALALDERCTGRSCDRDERAPSLLTHASPKCRSRCIPKGAGRASAPPDLPRRLAHAALFRCTALAGFPCPASR